jgi:hypothetical protein
VERRTLIKRLYLVAALAAAICVVISGSRAAALGLVVGVLVYGRMRGLVQHRSLQFAGRTLAALLLAFILLVIVFPDFGSALFRTETASRTLLWSRAILLAADRPYFGVGFGASDLVFFRDSLYLRSINVFISGSHSSPLRLLVDMGITGLALATMGFVATLRHSIRHLPRFHDPKLGAALIALTAASLTNSAFESWLFGFGSSSTVPFWLCLAVLSYQADAVNISRRTSRARAARGAVPDQAAATAVEH